MQRDDGDDPRLDSSGVAVLLSRLRAGIGGHREIASVLIALVALLLAVRGLHQETHEFLATGVGMLLVARAVALGRPLMASHVGRSVLLLVVAGVADATGHLAVAWMTVIGAGAVVGLPKRAPSPGTAVERRHVWTLVDATAGDTLAPFVLRTDKAYAFSPDRAAAVAYRVRFGTAIASGDPVGAPGSRDAAIDSFLAVADASGWRAAALGISDRSRMTWRRHGMRAVPIGRDVVLDVRTFSLEGRAFRNLRQAVQRSHNAGVTTEIVAECALSAAQRGELEQIMRAAGKGEHPRGFAMILDHPLDGTHPGTLVAIGRQRDGRAVAFQRYATADGGRVLSLDVPWRVPGAPNGVDERLITDVVAWAGERGGLQVSLTFAAFPELFEVKDRGVVQETAYRTVRLLDRFIRLESLYRFVRKFHALAVRRYVVLRPSQVLWVAVAALALEFGPPRRGDDRAAR